MSYIGRGTESISNVEVLDNLTFDGSASYTLQKSSTNFVPSSANNLLISISGVVQQGNFSVSGSTITFDTTVSGSDTCDWILHYGTGLITTVADGAITEAKLGNGAVTTAKINDGAITSAKLDSGLALGKIIGVQDNIISSLTITTSGTYSDVISTTYTPSSTSNYLLVHANIVYRLHGNSSTTTPNGYVQIASPTTARATRHIQTKLPANTDNEKGFASFYAYWNPNTTSSVDVKLRFKEDASGQFLLYGNSDYTRATSMTILEVSA